ncbi:MAG: acyltransferase [Acidobacteriota bacterium]|nr:acyltransferase [Acidobacteriota bacterium]
MSDTIADSKPPRSIWKRALWMADRTPEARNRYVDFLRALSILAVVLGHWLISAPYFANGAPAYDHLLDLAPWSRWLTWLFQVMPVFFFVGGFSNGVSWESAQRRDLGYRQWFDARTRRLIGPVLPLLLAWGIMVAVAHSNGVSDAMIRIGSKVALVPVWFLAVYIMVVALVPLTHAAWKRWGFASVVVPVAGAALVDVAFFAGGLRALGWLNYLFVWLTVHQFGYAWHDGRLGGAKTGLTLFGAGILALVGLTHYGPYPLSLVGVPSDEISNTLPPKLPLLALAAAQIGLVLTFEAPMRRLLQRRVPWAVTILINGMIMTVFLWHSTVMILLVGLAFWQTPSLLAQHPDTSGWWSTRPLWIAAYTVATFPFLVAFARFERPATGDEQRPATVGLQLFGCGVACFGLAMLALDGIGGSGWLGLRWVPLALPLLGAGLAGFGPLGRIGRSLSRN